MSRGTLWKALLICLGFDEDNLQTVARFHTFFGFFTFSFMLCVSKSITQLIQSASKVETPIPNPLKPSRNHTSSSSLYPISKVPPSIT
ncbi:hypothetical protein Lal_00011259 [Lupinus albus]|nr:hypothetical protein Lal_00011259 [Lupinus albus]